MCAVLYGIRGEDLLLRDCDDCSIFCYPARESYRADLASCPMYVVLNYLSVLILDEREIERNLLEDYHLNIPIYLGRQLCPTLLS